MSERFSLYSHTEDLGAGSLVLTDPFILPRDQSLICRYALHREKADVLAPDPAYEGIAAWHRMLPVQRTDVLPGEPSMRIEPMAEHPWGDQIGEVARLRIASALKTCAALPQALLSGHRSALMLDPTVQAVGTNELVPGFHLEQRPFSGSLFLAHQALAENTCNFGPWGNPFRVDGLKLLGLALHQHCRPRAPTVIVLDPTGELTLALVLAADYLRHFHQTPPYRVILVQPRPYDYVCRVFEGDETDDRTAFSAHDNRMFLPPPLLLADEVRRGLTALLGTAIAVDADPDDPESWLEPAMDLLLRTHFIDDEDQVLICSGV